ncbi:MAG: phosphate propanoyltransferase [Firmicutes bacterium]|nr:phosphate propanoyltransferase [Bacillota bacterium]
MNTDILVDQVTRLILKELQETNVCRAVPVEQGMIPIGISNRHVHISKEHMDILFGSGAVQTKDRDLSQPGQFVAEQEVTLVGPKGVIQNVRILGPERIQTQVEISISDCFIFGIQPPIRDSGDLEGSAGITLVGPKGSVTLNEGCIIAARHIHMSPADAEYFKVKHGDRVTVSVPGMRGVVFAEVLVRVNPNYLLEMHLDRDEANAASLKNGDLVALVR